MASPRQRCFHALWRRLHTLSLLMFLFGSSPILYAQMDLPDFGDPSEAGFSPTEEREAGKIFMQYIRQNLNFIDDADANRYVQRLGDQLLNSSKYVLQPISVFLIDDPAINAFAGPGGNIGLNSGMLLVADTESELASVIAHEMAHVTQRHIARLIQRGKETSLATWAGMATALVIGLYNPQIGGAALTALVGGNVQASLDNSREYEKEADRVGAQYLLKAGFNGQGMYNFFEKLHQSAQFSQSLPEFLSTHPLSTSRMADMRGLLFQPTTAQRQQSSLDFYLVKEKLHVLTSTRPTETLEWFIQRSNAVATTDRLSNNAITAITYGHALALHRLGRYVDAEVLWQRLVTVYPNQLSFWIALADGKLHRGEVAAALAIYENNIELYFDNKGLLQSYAAALLQQGDAAKVQKLLSHHGRVHGLNASLYRLLAEAYDQQGRTAESHLAIAEYHYANGHLGSAIDQIEYAQTVVQTDYLDLRLTARLKELRAERDKLPFGAKKPSKDKQANIGAY